MPSVAADPPVDRRSGPDREPRADDLPRAGAAIAASRPWATMTSSSRRRGRQTTPMARGRGSPTSVSLDDIDKAIIRELQVDGRMPYAKPGPAVGLSQAA